MKIEAIRVAEFGKFGDPVAIEGFSGGLDVLVGPNELGKSTLLKALELVFTMKFGSGAKALEDVRPYNGGAPTVEVDFMCAGRRWRLRKRWLAQRRAELRELSGESALYRGEDAETRLVALLGPRATQTPLSLLWVGQGASLAAFSVADSSRSVLDTVIAAEVQAIVRGDRARSIGERVRKALAELVTDRQRRPRGAYAEALLRRTAKEEALVAARRRLAEVEEALERLSSLRESERRLADPVAAASRRVEVGKARSALQEAREARGFAEQFAHERRSAEARLALARRDHDEFVAALVRLDALERADAEAAAVDTRSAVATTEVMRRHAEAGRRAEAAARLAEGVAAERDAAVAAQLEAVSRARVSELTARRDAARVTAARRDDLAARLSRMLVTSSLVDAARREARALDEAEARLSAGAATVHIAYRPDRVADIRVDGRVVIDGERLSAAHPLTLDVAGVGSVTVEPAGLETLEALSTRRDGHRQRLRELSAACGLAALDELETALAERRRLERELAEAQARLDTQAPDGLDALEARLEAARPGSGGEEHIPPTRSLADIEGDLRAVRASAAEAAEALAAIDRELVRLRESHIARRTAAQERASQREQIAATLPPPSERARHQAARTTALEEARTEAANAVREHTAWLERTPDEAALTRLSDAVTRAETAIADADRELVEVRLEAERWEGTLAAARNEDIASVVGELDDEVVRAGADVARFELEVAALARLEEELVLQARAVEAQFLEPVRARMLPYLRLLHADAEATLDPGFAVSQLVRRGVHEPLARLSEGTREQIAVLSRLAFAGMMAEAGHPTPVVLDDALVFSDDERLAGMFRALEQASTHHQTIVLTCRERSFAPLAGQRLALRRWHDFDG